MKCRFCNVEPVSQRGMIRHLNNKIKKLIEEKRKERLIVIILTLIVSSVFYLWIIPLIDSPTVPGFVVNVTLYKPNLAPNNTYFSKNIFWRGDYHYFDINIESSKARIFDAVFIIPFNSSIFAYDIETSLSDCKLIVPETFTYGINDTTYTGDMSEFDYSNPNRTITWGTEYILLKCMDMGIFGDFNMRVYTSSKAGFIPHNDTIAVGHYEGVRGEPTRIFTEVTFNR